MMVDTPRSDKEITLRTSFLGHCIYATYLCSLFFSLSLTHTLVRVRRLIGPNLVFMASVLSVYICVRVWVCVTA